MKKQPDINLILKAAWSATISVMKPILCCGFIAMIIPPHHKPLIKFAIGFTVGCWAYHPYLVKLMKGLRKCFHLVVIPKIKDLFDE